MDDIKNTILEAFKARVINHINSRIEIRMTFFMRGSTLNYEDLNDSQNDLNFDMSFEQNKLIQDKYTSYFNTDKKFNKLTIRIEMDEITKFDLDWDQVYYDTSLSEHEKNMKRKRR